MWVFEFGSAGPDAFATEGHLSAFLRTVDRSLPGIYALCTLELASPPAPALAALSCFCLTYQPCATTAGVHGMIAAFLFDPCLPLLKLPYLDPQVVA